MANYFSSSQIFPNPYTDRRYGGALSATQGFTNSYMQHLQFQRQMRGQLKDEQYRQSMMDITKSRLDISRQQLDLAKKREKRFGAPEVPEGFDRLEIETIAGSMADEGGKPIFEDIRQLGRLWNPEGSAKKQQQLETLWEITQQGQEPSFWDKLPEMREKAMSIAEPFYKYTPFGAVGKVARKLFPSEESIGEKKMELQTATAQRPFEQKSPYPEYPDAFLENGVWKVMKNGKKYRIE